MTNSVWVTLLISQCAYTLAAIAIGRANFGPAAGASWIGALLRLLEIIGAVSLALCEHALLMVLTSASGLAATAWAVLCFAQVGLPVCIVTATHWVEAHRRTTEQADAERLAARQ